MANSGGQEMVYPYTIAARFRQFPYKFYWKHNPHARHLTISFLICLPIFYKIQKLSCSPGNVAKFEEMKRKEEEHSAHKFDYH